MKVVAIADQHGFLPEIPECDVLLIAGDICPNLKRGEHKDASAQLGWLDGPFRKWLEGIDAEVFGVAGNHDWVFFCDHTKNVRYHDLPWTYLEDSGTEFNGLKIWGSPWQRKFYDWAFNLDEDELQEKWEIIPEDTDILITHSPPKMDTMSAWGDRTNDGKHVGSPTLRQRIEIVRPKLHVFGHIHSGRGQWKYDEMQLANVTVVNEQYKLVYDAMEFEIDAPS